MAVIATKKNFVQMQNHLFQTKTFFVAALRCNPKRHNMVFLWNFSCGQRIITGCQPRGVLLGMFRVCFVQQDFAYAS